MNDQIGRPAQRVMPKPKSGLQPEDIANRSGRYLFSFGYPGSGKTTFQWWLMNYLMNEGDFRTEIDIPETSNGSDWEGRRIINDWKQLWVEGRFPSPTESAESAIREVTCRVVPQTGQREPALFSFLEISGELLRMVMPRENEAPRIVSTIDAYFSNERLRFVVVLMLHPDIEENDQLFASFLALLKRRYPGMLTRMSLAIIVTKPSQSLERLRTFGDANGRRDFDQWDEEALHAYVDRFCGETYQLLRAWPDQRQTLLAPLDLGEIELRDDELRIVDPNFEHIDGIFGWIYHQFTGKHLGPTWWQRLFGSVGGGWK